MPKLRILPLAACLAILLVLPQAATACSSGCLYYQGWCGVCTYLGEGSGGACIQYDTCVCYDIQCAFASPSKEGELGMLEVFGPGAEQPTECSAPVSSAEPVWSL